MEDEVDGTLSLLTSEHGRLRRVRGAVRPKNRLRMYSRSVLTAK